ncbi:2-keto-4-pentenoate hydratase [soil metagenome]
MNVGEVNERAIASAFVSARRAGGALPEYPGVIPVTLEAAYAVQEHAISLDGRRIGGWKLGRIQPPQSSELGAERLAGPIFADTIVEANGAAVEMTVFPHGFAAAEAEFLLRIGADADPARTEWSLEDARALVDSVRVGIEIASSPLTTINMLGSAVTVSDFGNNNGLVLGPELPGWRDADLDTIAVELHIDGALIGANTTAAMLDGPYGSVRFLLGHAARRGRPLKAGDWISTGAVTGVHEVSIGARVEARFGNSLKVECVIVSEQQK